MSLPDRNYQFYGPAPSRRQQTKYLLNVCRSLVHTSDGFHCPYHSAACKATAGNVSPANWTFTNLGEVLDGPKIDAQHQLVLEYPMGGMCKDQNSPANHMSVKIIFR